MTHVSDTFWATVPSISALSGNNAIYISNREGKEIWEENHFNVNLLKSCCLKTDCFFLILKNAFGLSWWLNSHYVSIMEQELDGEYIFLERLHDGGRGGGRLWEAVD